MAPRTDSTIAIDSITAEWLAEHRPEVAEHFRTEGREAAEEGHADAIASARTEGATEGATAERTRIQAILGLPHVGHEDLVTELIADAEATPDVAARRILEAEKGKGAEALDELRSRTEPDKPPAPSSSEEDGGFGDMISSATEAAAAEKGFAVRS